MATFAQYPPGIIIQKGYTTDSRISWSHHVGLTYWRGKKKKHLSVAKVEYLIYMTLNTHYKRHLEISKFHLCHQNLQFMCYYFEIQAIYLQIERERERESAGIWGMLEIYVVRGMLQLVSFIRPTCGLMGTMWTETPACHCKEWYGRVAILRIWSLLRLLLNVILMTLSLLR